MINPISISWPGPIDYPHLLSSYTSNTVVYTATHDGTTARAWYEDLPDYQRHSLWKCLKRPTWNSKEAAPALIHLAWSSPAALAIAPLQDLLNLGEEARINVPGRPEGNWSWRSTEDMLSADAFQDLRDLTETSRRLAVANEDYKSK